MEIVEFVNKDYKVFFSNKGVTSTSANHVCNKGKELLKADQTALDNINFINTTACLLSGGEPHIITNGMTANDFAEIENKINKIHELNAMTAWIREAIKAKNTIIDFVSHISDMEWSTRTGIAMPESPHKEPYTFESNVLGSWDVEKRNRYYRLDAYCSLVGKLIHPSGSFYEAKKNINNAIQNPNKVDGSGRDAIIYSYAPSLTSEEVTNEYNKLATELRHKEAELNKMKAEIDDAIIKDKIAKNVAYETKCEAYRQDLKAFREKMNDWKIKATDEANKLKIYLPDGPKQTYDKINKGEF